MGARAQLVQSVTLEPKARIGTYVPNEAPSRKATRRQFAN